MSVAKVGLLDTSVFIAREDGRPLGVLLERATISVITIGELQLGVLNAADDEILPVVTQDGDYEKIAGAHPALRVSKV